MPAREKGRIGRDALVVAITLRLACGWRMTTRALIQEYRLPKATAVRYMTLMECLLPVANAGTDKNRILLLPADALPIGLKRVSHADAVKQRRALLRRRIGPVELG